MKLSIVIPLLNQHLMATSVIDVLLNVTDKDAEIVVIDNGSDVPFVHKDERIKVVRNEKSIGVYPTFEKGFKVATGDVIAFFHSDLIVWEKGWDSRVLGAFMMNPKLGMIGFIGSNEIDTRGGRGLGTTSNFSGGIMTTRYMDTDGSSQDKTWSGSVAGIHGKTSSGISNAAVVDGCAMIIRRETWNKIGVKEGFPPHHFYDRLISTQVLASGYEIAVLGIACDHISGQTVNQESKYQKMAWEWLVRNNITPFPLSDFDKSHNYDNDIYKLAEKMWMEDYKNYIPYKVQA